MVYKKKNDWKDIKERERHYELQKHYELRYTSLNMKDF